MTREKFETECMKMNKTRPSLDGMVGLLNVHVDYIKSLEKEIVKAHARATNYEINFMMDCPIEIEDCKCYLCADSRNEMRKGEG